MDDPTKDTIPRSAVEYCLRKETVSTNPEKYKTHEKFIDYMNDPDISEFGHWMHENGYNCALVSVAVDLKKIPSVTLSAQPGWIPVTERFPDKEGTYLCTVQGYVGKTTYLRIADFHPDIYVEYDIEEHKPGFIDYDSEYGFYEVTKVLAWQPLPSPYREGGQDEN